MGVQVEAGPYEINTTIAARLVSHLTHRWYDEARDAVGDDPESGPQQFRIDAFALQRADHVVPKTYKAYRLRPEPRLPLFDFTEEDFDRAREFIHQAAVAGLSADYSY
jgi:hypothetical protein